MKKIILTSILLSVINYGCDLSKTEVKKEPINLTDKQKDSLTSILQQASIKNDIFKIDEVYNTYIKPNIKDSNDVQFYLQRAQIKLLKSDFKSALQDINKAEKIDPKTAHVHFMKGLIIGTLYPNSVDSSIKYISIAINLAPNDPLYLQSRSEIYHSYNNYSKAIDDINKAIKLNPNKLWFYNLRASYLYSSKSYELALKDFSFCIEHKKTDGDLFYFKGMCLYFLGKHESAIESFEMALKINPANGAYYTANGAAKFKLKNRDAACEDFKKAMELGDVEGKKYYYQCLEWYEKHKKA